MRRTRVSAGLALLGLALLGAQAGCRTARVPYPLERVAPRAVAAHPRSVAVLPFVDARRGPDGDGDEDVYVYNGVEMDTTRLASLHGSAERAFAELLARHLVRAGVFARVILVESAKDAPEAELLLTARIQRARGYVERDARDGEALRRRQLPESARGERTVIAEVWLADVTVAARGAPDRPLFRADVGWSIAEERAAVAEVPDPWAVLGDALAEAFGQASRLLAGADLSGRSQVIEQVELAVRTGTSAPPLEALVAPEGWRVEVRTGTAAPHGWRARAGGCRRRALIAEHTQRFHRALGPYVPTVELWWCDAGSRLAYDATVELPALYLGPTPSGAHLFVHTVGASNWPGAPAQLARWFGAVAPAKRYVFEVGP